MIHHVEGTVLAVDIDSITVGVSGIGYKIATPPRGKRRVGDTISLWTHLVVREDRLELFGFEEKSELSFFEMLISVSGVGPKSALAILSMAPVDTLQNAIGKSDVVYLTKVSGVGKKTAEKIVLELRDKVGKNEGSAGELDSEVLDALMALGYGLHESRDALKKISEKTDGAESRIKEALKFLSNA